jgi:hypothetical protein
LIKFSGLKQKKQLAYILKQQISRDLATLKVKALNEKKEGLNFNL